MDIDGGDFGDREDGFAEDHAEGDYDKEVDFEVFGHCFEFFFVLWLEGWQCGGGFDGRRREDLFAADWSIGLGENGDDFDGWVVVEGL